MSVRALLMAVAQQQRRGASYPPIIDDGNTVGWYDFTDVVKDGANSVSQWNDKKGINHLTQFLGEAARQPLWTSDGITFDGANDILGKTFEYDSPYIIYMILRQNTWTAAFKALTEGGVNAVSSPFVLTRNASPQIQHYNKQYSKTISPPIGEFRMITLTHDFLTYAYEIGIQLDQEAKETAGNINLLHMKGFRIGGSFGQHSYSNITVKEIILRKTSFKTEDLTIIQNYLKAKYGTP